jgi:sRNA-binding regulator protein Hfq
VESANRKLIRPSFNEFKEKADGPRKAPAGAPQKRQIPPDQTNAENFYYVKQMQAKTPMVFVLRDGETLHGVIEWYDKTCLKVNRIGEPNLLLYKPNIKYMYKE